MLKLFPLFLAFCINVLNANDFIDASKAFKLDARILWAIAYKESRHTSNIISKPNKNGTYDIGIMQINSMHLKRLEKEYGISQKDLLQKPRVNIFVGAMILRKCFDLYGVTEKGITCYNGLKQGNPYGKDILKIIENKDKEHRKKQINKSLNTYFLLEQKQDFIKVINYENN
ncbi:lytic transglycosylase domain-containing protein [Campylobacter troglodytis]|uniref:lytic transglycosylase domain-containing protein n=1 Tax=Campylobacter troglodytis TaxID=654363 RepID=UPI00115A1A62|nr:lytic transglycosylase domain-containing protein [Campylobacter troglodytis]TQR53184.1 twitching motility protein PilT [Campylobacter troglodytis]